MKPYHNVFIILAGFLICGRYYAQSSLNEIAGNINPGLMQNSKETELRLIYLNVLKDPETLNFIMKDSFRKKEEANFLEDLQIKFQTLQTDKKSYLGISYDFKRNFAPVYFKENSTDKSGLDVSFAATGNISLDRAYNPNDFLKTSLSFGYFNSTGGAVAMTDEISGKLTGIQIELSKLNKDELNKSELWRDYLSFAADYLTTQIYFDFSFKGSLESNQDFTSKQYTFGAQLGFDLKAWNR